MELFSHKQKVLPVRKIDLTAFQKNINIKFKDISLLDLAFHHRSYANESAITPCNNERLEFLGDAVLGMAVAGFLYEKLCGHNEGDLAKTKSVVVSEVILSEIALNIKIDQFLLLGKGEELSGGRQKKALLADALEAVIGAFYLDSGYRAAEKLVLHLIVPEIEKVLNNKHHKDYKTLLQEFCQKKYKTCPMYELVKNSGPDHDRTFWVKVDFGTSSFGPAQGKSKKEAEQAAAEKACKTLHID